MPLVVPPKKLILQQWMLELHQAMQQQQQ